MLIMPYQLWKKKQDAEEFNKSKIVLSYITKLRQLALDPSVTINDYMGKVRK